jgi:hypothetical protein
MYVTRQRVALTGTVMQTALSGPIRTSEKRNDAVE